MEFANKEYFLLLLLLIPYVLWYFLYRKKSEPTMRMSDTHAYLNAPKSWRERIMDMPMLLRCITFALIVIILARRPITRGATRRWKALTSCSPWMCRHPCSLRI